jgi:hypothetical protein
VVVNVDNTPPKIDLKNSLNIMGRTSTVITFDAGSGFDHGIMTISGNGIQPVKISFTSNSASMSWDGLGGDGRTAPFGVFDVTVDAWDKVGNHSSTHGYWMRPAPIQPTAAPTALGIAMVPTAGPDTTTGTTVTTAPQPLGIPLWGLFLPFGVGIVWLFTNGLPFTFDRRWSEVRKLQREIIAHQKIIQTTEEGVDHDR